MNYGGFYPTNYEDNIGTLASSVFVQDTHFFADATERNSYFATHPTELVDDLFVVVGGSLFQYEISSLTWNQFSILVRGEKGEKGDTGLQGIQGLKGDTGDTGSQGVQGIQGERGYTGDAATVAIGSVTQGSSMAVTNSGTSGAAVLNFTLVKGDKGDKGDIGNTGATGLQGIQGLQGVAGASTYAALTDKISVDLPAINTPLSTALSGKQASLVSGTNIRTVNGISMLSSGNIAVQPTLVSGTNIKTVNSVSLLGSGDIAQICGSQVFSVGRSMGSGTVTVGNTFGNLNDVYVDHANLDKTTGTFTIPVSGNYQFNVRALKTTGANNLQIALRINGSTARHAIAIDGVAPYMSYLPVSLTHIAYFTAGQAIDAVVQLGTAHGDAEFTFSGFRVS